jgi:hypothetical protein
MEFQDLNPMTTQILQPVINSLEISRKGDSTVAIEGEAVAKHP